MDPVFLTEQEVIEIHAEMLAEYGGSPGLRDQGLLDSAVAQPRVTFGDQFLHGSLHEMAAAYLFHLVRNHPFVDGNKRTGAASAIVFLLMNGLTSTASEDEYYDLVIAVAKGRIDKIQIAEFFQHNTTTDS